MLIDGDDPLAVEATTAVQTGDLETLRELLDAHPGLATARIGDPDCSRTLLHAATDWPGHFPNGPEVVAALVDAGADVNARFRGGHRETPLHWAASSNDVSVLDALLDAGADIEASGAVLGGGSPLADACGFGNWEAARRLVERGARTRLKDAAALGLLDRVRRAFDEYEPPGSDDINRAFWSACHGGQRATAAFLLDHGADINRVGWDDLTPLDAARHSGAGDLVEWLERPGRQVHQRTAWNRERPQPNGVMPMDPKNEPKAEPAPDDPHDDGRRWWMVVLPFVGCLGGGVIAFALKVLF